MESRKISLLAIIVANIRSGITFLRFPHDSEKAFLHYYYKRSINQIRIALILAIFLYESVALIDPYVVPLVISKIWFLRFAVVLPVFLTALLMTYIVRSETFTQIACFFAITVASFAVSAMLFIDHGIGSLVYFAGWILTTIYGYTFMRMRFGYATACGLISLAFYVLTAIFIRRTDIPVLINNTVFGIIANFIGMFVAYTLEINMRSEYLNIMAMKRTHKGLQKLSLFDDLTKIANRRLFELRLSAEFSESERLSKPLSLIMADVDFFKDYNDNLGHQAGDECLIQIAKKLQQCATRAGDLAARYGGEEFAVILSDTPLAGARVVAEKMRQEIKALRIAHPLSPGAVVSMSFGIASVIPSHKNSSGGLIKAADDALYLAKNNGRDRIECGTEA